MLPLVASRGVPVVLMHMQGTPQTMQVDPRYTDVIREVIAFLSDRVRVSLDLGIAREHILLDPGIGFGKRIEHNLTLLRDTRKLADGLRHPMVVGAAEKGLLERSPANPSHVSVSLGRRRRSRGPSPMALRLYEFTTSDR